MTTLSTTPISERPAASSAARATLPSEPLEPGAPAFDRGMILLVGVLMTFGVAIVYSASVTLAGEPLNLRHWWNTPLRQSVFAVIGFVMMIMVAMLDYRVLAWQRPHQIWRSGFLAVLAAGLLIAVLIPGVGSEVLGAKRSIVLFRGAGLGFQPSEFAKVVLVIWLAALLSGPGIAAADPRRIARGAGIQPGSRSAISHGRVLLAIVTAGILIGLTGIEDFGTAALMGVVMMLMLYLARAPWRYLITLVLLGGAAAAGLVLMKPYRLQRIMTFMAETPDPMGEGYQVTQALIAIGSGGWWGRGLGGGIQKYGYLPQDNNDFVLAIVCEELGVVGGIAICVLFLLLLLRGWWISSRCGDDFGRLLAAGLTLTICIQAAFNIGVVTDSIPTKGISLPFVSAGGSGVLFLGVAAGLLASVARGAAPRVPQA